MTRANLNKERAWLERKLRQNRIGVLLWNMKVLILDVLFVDDLCLPNLAFFLHRDFKVSKNKRGTKTIIPIVTNITGEDTLVWCPDKNEFWVYIMGGYRKEKCEVFKPGENVIRDWIDFEFSYYIKFLNTDFFSECPESKVLRRIMCELKELILD